MIFVSMEWRNGPQRTLEGPEAWFKWECLMEITEREGSLEEADRRVRWLVKNGVVRIQGLLAHPLQDRQWPRVAAEDRLLAK
jgi:hypothetical protein